MIGHLPPETAAMRSCRVRMSRYDGLLRLAESMWQKELATKVAVQA